ncbi:MAG: pectinesterase family protein [Marinoscillum sp.]
MYRNIALITFILSASVCAHSQVFDAVIAADGSGDYTSIQSAVDRIRTASERHIFYIKPGVYVEKVSIAKDNVSLIGSGTDEVVVSWDDYSGDDDGHSTSSSYTFQVDGDNFYAENITFKNTAGNVGQAVAVSTTGTHQVFRNCSFLGFQDTYYARKGMQYLNNCYIEGATDFIFGESTAVFDECEIVCVQGGQYITAPADTKLISQVNGEPFYHGLFFLESEIIAGAGVGDDSYYLGRPWQPNSTSVYVNCILGTHIKSEGWSEWNDNNHLSAFFAEYNSMNSNEEPIDVSGRVNWSVQLTESERSNYELDFFLNGWDPKESYKTTDIPVGMVVELSKDTVRIEWSGITGAIGYAVMKNNSVYGFSENLSFKDAEGLATDEYAVASINGFGVFSDYSGPAKPSVVLSNEVDIHRQLKNGILYMSEPVKIQVYSLTGKKLITRHHENQINLSGLKQGVYLITLEDSHGRLIVEKVAI